MQLVRIFTVFFIIGGGLISGCKTKKDGAAGGGARRNSGPILVEGFVVQKSSVSEDVEVPGTLLPAEETQIRAEVSGRVVKMNINEGSTVKSGELLVKLF